MSRYNITYDFNSRYVLTYGFATPEDVQWILENGFWNDNGEWIDSETWND